MSCSRQDYSLVKGCCASIRAHLGDIPICLIPDGPLSVAEVRDRYGVMVLAREQVDTRLHRSYGYGLTKMISFWHSPFDRFLHVDADTICWGDVLRGVPWKEYDFIYNEPHELITPWIQKSQYFDPDRLFELIQFFPWERNPYFNSGCFIARKGILDLESYIELLDIQRKNPGIFISGEQGILNLMVFQEIARGKIKARAWPLQAVVPVIPPKELAYRFRFSRGKPIVRETDRRIIHWAGAKPYLIGGASFLRPMVYYRLEHLRNTRSSRGRLGRLGLMLEEVGTSVATRHEGSYLRGFRSKAHWILGKAVKRLRQKPSTSRVA
jgi:hypothetical protein